MLVLRYISEHIMTVIIIMDCHQCQMLNCDVDDFSPCCWCGSWGCGSTARQCLGSCDNPNCEQTQSTWCHDCFRDHHDCSLKCSFSAAKCEICDTVYYNLGYAPYTTISSLGLLCPKSLCIGLFHCLAKPDSICGAGFERGTDDDNGSSLAS